MAKKGNLVRIEYVLLNEASWVILGRWDIGPTLKTLLERVIKTLRLSFSPSSSSPFVLECGRVGVLGRRFNEDHTG